MIQQEIFIDISYIIKATINRRRATGVERVALAYIRHFSSKSRALIAIRGHVFVLSRKRSRQIFYRLLRGQRTLSFTLIFLIIKSYLLPSINTKTQGAILLKLDEVWLNCNSYFKGIKRKGIRPIFMIHDLIPIKYPEYFASKIKSKYHKQITNVLNEATGIITNSAETYKEVIAFANLHKLTIPPIVPILLGSDHVEPNIAVHRPIESNYFVIISTIEGRKNHLLLLQIWRILVDKYKEKAPKIVIIGQLGWCCNSVQDLLKRCEKIRDFTIRLTPTDEELYTYLRYAQALLFPTFSEGYGFPLVEALSAEVPVIASNLEVFKEIAGDVPEYIHPIDGAKWLATIEEYMLPNSTLRNNQIKRIKRLSLPNWNEHFKKVNNFLKTLEVN